MRASGSDNTVTLRPPKQLSLDQYIEFIAEDELVEVTPVSLRLRKMELDQNKRASQKKKEKRRGPGELVQDQRALCRCTTCSCGTRKKSDGL